MYTAAKSIRQTDVREATPPIPRQKQGVTMRQNIPRSGGGIQGGGSKRALLRLKIYILTKTDLFFAVSKDKIAVWL